MIPRLNDKDKIKNLHNQESSIILNEYPIFRFYKNKHGIKQRNNQNSIKLF